MPSRTNGPYTAAMPTRGTFPHGFTWGTATSAHQVEGGNVANDWWDWEHRDGRVCAETSGDACDHYHLYRDDIALLSRLGFNSYRFSIEWSRVEPAPGEYSDAALRHYRRMAVACTEHGLAPAVAFHHFTNPRWIAERGAWQQRSTADAFARFVERACDEFGELIALAITINEPNMPALLGYEEGLFPPGLRSRDARLRATDTFVEAHHRARDAIRRRSAAPVGIALAMADWHVVDAGEAQLEDIRRLREDVFLQACHDDDYIGVNTYTRHRVGPEGFLPPEDGVELTVMGYEFWPDSLGATVRRAWNVTGKPIVVTENGIGTDDDRRRIAYIASALDQLTGCIDDGIDIRGYFYWSALDNFEWNHGYAPKFGLIAVDRETQRRTPKRSARWLGDVARRNGLSRQPV